MPSVRPVSCLAFVLAALPLNSVVSATEIEASCVVRELDEVDIPARRDGVLAEVSVRRGVRVAAEQVVAMLDQTEITLEMQVTQAELDQASVKAKNRGALRKAQAAVKLSKQELALLKELGEDAVYLERFRMQNNLEKADAELVSSENELKQDEMQVVVKRKELQVKENNLRETRIQSPVNGVVQELKKNEGEWVHRGDPILVVTRMDRLIAEGFLDSAQFAAHSIVGAPVRITIQIDGEKTFDLDGLRVREAGSKLELDGKFPIWVEFDNQLVKSDFGEEVWLIRPSMRAKMTILLGEEPALEEASQSEASASRPVAQGDVVKQR